MRTFQLILLLAASPLSLAISENTALAQVLDTREKVEAKADFKLQGEYLDSTRGLQVIALGEGEFQVVTLAGGLPGAGWNGQDRQVLELDAEQVEVMLKNFRRVERVSPTLGAEPPSNAVVLFDGTQESVERHWQAGANLSSEGWLEQGCTSLQTFQDYHLHLEFRLPFMPSARGQGRGNSGLYHQGRYETQILDSFGLEGKMNEAGGIYSIRDPDLNMCLPPMSWQTYDVQFTSARFGDDGKKLANAKITVKLNGVVVHRDVELTHATTAAPVKEGAAPGPIYLQDHGNPVRFRNIWVVPRDVEAEARRPIVPAFERFYSSFGNKPEGGRLLIGELNCVACHAAGEHLADIEPKSAPVLDNLGKRVHPGWVLKFLQAPHEVKPGTTMPDLLSALSSEQREKAALALTNFLVKDQQIDLGGKPGNTATGERLFHQSGCTACHLPQNGSKASEATSVPLVGLGEKYSRSSLEQFLRDPLEVRPSGRMPRLNLGGDAWAHVAQYLTGDEAVVFGDQRELPKEPNMRFAAYYGSYDKLPNIDELEPDLTGLSRGLDIAAGKRSEAVVIRYEGYLPIKTDGMYSFRITSDDGSRLSIDGKQILDNDGIHPEQSAEATLRLTPGYHKIRVDWFENSGGEALRLVWAGPGIESGFIDKSIVLENKEGESFADTLPPLEPEGFTYDPTLVDAGREYFVALGCAACHERREAGKRIVSTLKAPPLQNNTGTGGCLQPKKHAQLPNYDLTTAQVEAIQAAIQSQSANAGQPEQEISRFLERYNCLACHQRGGVGGPEADRNGMFVSTIPEMGDEGRLPPPLDRVGDKLRKEWIQAVIEKGDKSRPYMRAHMPGFGESAGKELSKLLAAVDQVELAEIPELNQPENRQIATGRKLVGAKGFACVGCHTYGNFKAAGIQAIALDTMTQRVREDWFHRYLPDPQAYRPGTRMPTGFPNGESTVQEVYEGNPGKQIAAMWSYLKQGDKGGVPEGIVGGMIELKPVERPVIYRNFIAGVSPRGIAVGYPEKANLCWDAETMSLALIWQDRFLDASKHWVGRGPGTQVPLGGSVESFESVSPVALLQDIEESWPADPPRERGFRFLGYQLDALGRPTFRYQSPWASIEDFPGPVAKGDLGTFRREFTILPKDGLDTPGKIYFRAAQGQIQETTDAYLVDGTLSIRIEGGGKPVLRQVGDEAELLVPIEGKTTIIQHLSW